MIEDNNSQNSWNLICSSFFLKNLILSRFKILENYNIFKGFVSCLFVIILFCILLMRKKVINTYPYIIQFNTPICP